MSSPRDCVCPNCNAQPGEPCTQPTDNGRHPIHTYHYSRDWSAGLDSERWTVKRKPNGSVKEHILDVIGTGCFVRVDRSDNNEWRWAVVGKSGRNGIEQPHVLVYGRTDTNAQAKEAGIEGLRTLMYAERKK